MNLVFDNIESWLSLLPRFSFTNFIEVIIISVIVYELLLWIKNSRAWTLLKGLLVILVFTALSALLELDTILWILEKVSTIAVIVIAIIFQPELRKGLEQLGSGTFIGAISIAQKDDTMTKDAASQISKAVFEMAKVKTGALIVIQQGEPLDDFVSTGIAINGMVSSGLLINIFEKNTPLHDGAVIIKGNTVLAATCYLPLSDNKSISKDLGTRHRAALGISEVTDSVTLVVSEETGGVSVAHRGVLTHINDEKQLDEVLAARINKAEMRLFKKALKKKEEDAGVQAQ